jgi:uncharacterized protein (DUF2062 family)
MTESSPLFFRGKITVLRDLLYRLLLRGHSRRRLAWALALGVTLGLAPLVWGTTLLCLLLAVALRLPVVVVQAANYAVYPLQIALVFPFLTAGQYLLAPGQPEVLPRLRETLAVDPLLCARLFWQVNLRGLAVWLVLAPLLMWLAYRLAHRLLPEESR